MKKQPADKPTKLSPNEVAPPVNPSFGTTMIKIVKDAVNDTYTPSLPPNIQQLSMRRMINMRARGKITMIPNSINKSLLSISAVEKSNSSPCKLIGTGAGVEKTRLSGMSGVIWKGEII